MMAYPGSSLQRVRPFVYNSHAVTGSHRLGRAYTAFTCPAITSANQGDHRVGIRYVPSQEIQHTRPSMARQATGRAQWCVAARAAVSSRLCHAHVHIHDILHGVHGPSNSHRPCSASAAPLSGRLWREWVPYPASQIRSSGFQQGGVDEAVVLARQYEWARYT